MDCYFKLTVGNAHLNTEQNVHLIVLTAMCFDKILRKTFGPITNKENGKSDVIKNYTDCIIK